MDEKTCRNKQTWRGALHGERREVGNDVWPLEGNRVLSREKKHTTNPLQISGSSRGGVQGEALFPGRCTSSSTWTLYPPDPVPPVYSRGCSKKCPVPSSGQEVGNDVLFFLRREVGNDVWPLEGNRALSRKIHTENPTRKSRS